MDDYAVLGAGVTAALLAGLYLAFAVAVMPALHQLGDAQFVDTMNRINVSIVNPVFLVVFFGAPLLAVVAGALVRTPTSYAAAALGVITLPITLAVNVPLNNQLAAGAPRADFENVWVLCNALRTLTGNRQLRLPPAVPFDRPLTPCADGRSRLDLGAPFARQ